MKTALAEETKPEVKPLNNNQLVLGGLTWFEIPTLDIRRAVIFYQAILGRPLIDLSHDEPMFMLPNNGGTVTGALIQREGVRPGPRGIRVYLRVMDSLATVRERVVAAGGLLVTDPTAVPNAAGIFCTIRDIEGNCIGIHAQN